MKSIKKQKSENLKGNQLNLFNINRNYRLEQLSEALWKVCHATFWNHKEFSLKQQEEFKTLITEHFLNGKNEKRNFKDLVQRICLAKRYLSRKRGRYISKPIDWLNIHYAKGLIGTSQWLNEVNEQRKEVPHYNEGITTLANGILKFIDSPNIIVYQRYRRMLTENNHSDLLQIFNNTIINLQYAL
jgi:hypothetical protein